MKVPLPEGYPFGYRMLDIGCDEHRRALGYLFGYPKCCVEEFVSDVREGLMPGLIRGVTKAGYVPCSRCYWERSGPRSLEQARREDVG